MVLTVFIGFFPQDTYAISARSAVIIDANSGRVLYEHNKDEKRGMASTTKIMTALCALEYGDMNKMVTISPTASGVEGSSMYLAKGEKISMSDLVYGLMLVSGNDSATAIAETISGSVEKFAELMNKKAEEIGCYNTHFTNPHGLSDESHYTTAHDLAKITAYAMQNPIFCEIAATKKKTLPANEGGIARTLVNHNKFLSMYEGCIGVKTGFTKATGRCLVTSVEKNGMRLICVTLNASDDWNDHTLLYNEVFSRFHNYKVLPSNSEVIVANLKNGRKDKITLVTNSDIFIPIETGEENMLSTNSVAFEEIYAPIKKGDILGTLTIKINDTPCGEYPLVANEDISEKQTIFKETNTIGYYIKELFLSWLLSFQS